MTGALWGEQEAARGGSGALVFAQLRCDFGHLACRAFRAVPVGVFVCPCSGGLCGREFDARNYVAFNLVLIG